MIPSTLTIGLSWEWTASFADYPAGDYSLSYTLINSTNKITIPAAASGDDFAVTVAAATTAGYTAGDYAYQAIVTSGSDSYLAEEGSVTLQPGFAALTTSDRRSHAKKVLDAIEALLENKAGEDQQQIMIAGRQITTFSPFELLRFRDRYRAEYQRELRAERVARGESGGRTIKTRFTT